MTEANTLDVSEPTPLGEVTVRWNGHVIKIHCSHRNMIVMQNAWGQDDFMQNAIQAMNFGDLDGLASMYSFCASLNGSDRLMDREEYLDLCLPLNIAIGAMRTSWHVAWNGFEEPEQLEESERKKRWTLRRIFKPRSTAH